MHFPVGLHAHLLRRKVVNALIKESPSAIFHLSPLVAHLPPRMLGENLTPEREWRSPQACVQAAAQAGAPVVWLGGTEPLFHSEIGDVTSALTDAGHYVFLHTSGVGLRKRIHEFKPVRQLYLCFEVPLDDAARPGSGAGVPLETIAEGIRASLLSGFHVCAHMSIAGPACLGAIPVRVSWLQSQKIDGFAMSSGAMSPAPGENDIAANLLAEAARMIPVNGWRVFSRFLEASYLRAARASSEERPTSDTREAEACEETA